MSETARLGGLKRKGVLPSSIPDWPYGLAARAAAAFCGCSVSALRQYGPAPTTIGRRSKVWRLPALMKWLDELGGESPDKREDHNPWDDV